MREETDFCVSKWIQQIRLKFEPGSLLFAPVSVTLVAHRSPPTKKKTALNAWENADIFFSLGGQEKTLISRQSYRNHFLVEIKQNNSSFCTRARARVCACMRVCVCRFLQGEQKQPTEFRYYFLCLLRNWFRQKISWKKGLVPIMSWLMIKKTNNVSDWTPG